MTLIDKFKKVDLTKVVDMASNVINTTKSKKESNTLNISESKEQVIDSVDSLNLFLKSLQPEASPSVMMALQSQLYVLKFVQSPTMALMAVDNILVCLYKALKSADSNEEKTVLRETFCSLIQSFIFLIEARLRYEIDSNRDESVRLLADAGDMLMSSVSSTASLVVPIAAGIKMGNALPKMVNVLASNTEQNGFLGRLIMAKGKKAQIEEKKQEFDKTLCYIFETLDNYSELIGPSIQLHGMLKRYADGLVDRYTKEQYASVAKQINEKEAGKLEALIDTTSQAITSDNETTGIKLLLKAVSQFTKPASTIDYMSVRNIKRSLQCDLEGYMTQNDKLKKDIHATEEILRNTSLLQFGKKSKLQERISNLQAERNSLEQTILDFERRINVVSTIIDPVDENIEVYSANLQRIVEKYKYNLESSCI
jgi:hypothetical protein